MRNKIALLLAVLMLASALLCGCGEEKTLEPWTMPAVDAKPTVEPTPTPVPTQMAVIRSCSGKIMDRAVRPASEYFPT